jgi:hypothetical protein
MTIEVVIASLDAFVPSEERENIDRLYQCLAPLASLAPTARLPAVPAMLRLIERSPDAEFGSPGPLVHELEEIPGYEDLLMESLQRQPESVTVWMANRILNSDTAPDTRARWLAILTEVRRHPKASESTKAAAAEFIEHQIA